MNDKVFQELIKDLDILYRTTKNFDEKWTPIIDKGKGSLTYEQNIALSSMADQHNAWFLEAGLL